MKKGLLLGAGFSYDFGMPLGKDMTDIFLALFDWWQVKKLIFLLSLKESYGKDRPINRKAISECLNMILSYKKVYEKSGGDGNYEDLIGSIEAAHDIPGKSLTDRDSYSFVLSFLYDVIYKILELYQNESYSRLYERAFPLYSKLNNILSDEETWVANLNHDLYLECLAIDLGIPLTQGDTGTIYFPIDNRNLSDGITFLCSKRKDINFDHYGFFKGQKGINLIKIHGGLSELEYKDRNIICNLNMNYGNSRLLISDYNRIEKMAFYVNGQPIPCGKDRVVSNEDGELDIIVKAMMTGRNKYSKTSNPKEGEEKLILLDKMLDSLDELTIIGYGFGDKHINYRLSNAMVRNNSLNLWIISPGTNRTPEILEQFDYKDRIRRATCSGSACMSYIEDNKWDMENEKQAKENLKIRDEIKKAVLSFLAPNKSL